MTDIDSLIYLSGLTVFQEPRGTIHSGPLWIGDLG